MSLPFELIAPAPGVAAVLALAGLTTAEEP
jgi:hypothetical protein